MQDIKFKIPGFCKGCGKCCMLVLKRETPIYEFHTGDSNLEILNIIYGKCEYLDDKNECMINDKKPQCCKDLTRESMQCLDFLRMYEENKL
jgi:hypothetical protein